MVLPNGFRRHRSRASQRERKRRHEHDPKPVYIYPGVIRMSSAKAITIDTRCPAGLFLTRQTNKDGSDSCSVCLDEFVSGRDIVRRLPCGHIFHSRCILSWVYTADRCPNCNDPVVNRELCNSPPVNHGSSDPPLAGEPADDLASVPDTTPSTVCQLPIGVRSAKDAVSASGDVPTARCANSRSYSFVLHDQARFAELLERVFQTKWTPSM